jgi:hypothetical protein
VRSRTWDITKIHDSYVDDNEDELFLCCTNIDEVVRWFNKADMPKELYEPFRLFKVTFHKQNRRRKVYLLQHRQSN